MAVVLVHTTTISVGRRREKPGPKPRGLEAPLQVPTIAVIHRTAQDVIRAGRCAKCQSPRLYRDDDETIACLLCGARYYLEVREAAFDQVGV
jgi:hypothetical protein